MDVVRNVKLTRNLLGNPGPYVFYNRCSKSENFLFVFRKHVFEDDVS